MKKELTFEEFKKLSFMEKIIAVFYVVFVYGLAYGLSVFLVSSLIVYLAEKGVSILEEKNRPIVERKVLLYRYNWDGAGEEELLRRVMLYSNLSPEELGRYFPKQELGRVFLKNIHDFNEEKRKLWINYLNIPEEEVEILKRK